MAPALYHLFPAKSWDDFAELPPLEWEGCLDLATAWTRAMTGGRRMPDD